MMQWPDWFSHTDRYWLVCALNEHAYKGEPASIDALIGAVLERLPSHLSTRPERPEVLAVIRVPVLFVFILAFSRKACRGHDLRSDY